MAAIEKSRRLSTIQKGLAQDKHLDTTLDR
jgi:hypothetical protein